jgi:hypothetical protein
MRTSLNAAEIEFGAHHYSTESGGWEQGKEKAFSAGNKSGSPSQ